jgi:ribonuclease Z
LIGLINSFGLLNHLQDLHIYAPAPLQQIIEWQLKVANTILPYQLFFHTIDKQEVLLNEEKIVVKCFPTNHRIECYGFSFHAKKGKRKLIPEKAGEYEIPVSFYEKLKEGEDYLKKNGELVKNEWVTEEGPPGKTYVYCADTKYDESIIPHISDADLIYHETTYLDALQQRAIDRFHSTTKQAALIAKKANVRRLLIGHFSSKYDTLEEFETEAREVFLNTEIAMEGVTYKV